MAIERITQTREYNDWNYKISQIYISQRQRCFSHNRARRFRLIKHRENEKRVYVRCFIICEPSNSCDLPNYELLGIITFVATYTVLLLLDKPTFSAAK